jgi:hypothetical protein
MLQILINNGQRVGVLTNMTICHVKQAKKEGGSMLTLVRTFFMILLTKDLDVKRLDYGIQGFISFQIPAHKTVCSHHCVQLAGVEVFAGLPPGEIPLAGILE